MIRMQVLNEDRAVSTDLAGAVMRDGVNVAVDEISTPLDSLSDAASQIAD